MNRILKVLSNEEFNELLKTNMLLIDWKVTIDNDNITKYHVIFGV